MKSKVTKNIKYLRKCTDYTSKKASEAFEALSDLDESIPNQPDLKKVIGAHVAEQQFGQLFTKMWASLAGFIAHEYEDCHENLLYMIGTYVNFTDISSEFCAELGKTDCIPLLIGTLENCQQDLLSDDGILESILALLLNVVQNCSNNIRVFRRVNAVQVLKKYLNIDNPTAKLDVLTILAFIANETERGLLQTVDGAVSRLVTMVINAVYNDHDESHRVYDGGSCSVSALELLQGLNRLAINDANKVEIAKQGGIPVFIRMLQDDFSEDEQIAAVKTLWNLAFIEELRKSTELQESTKCKVWFSQTGFTNDFCT